MSKLGTALVAAGFFTTGIIIGNVEWNGSDSVSNIEDNVTQMEQDISEALSDNEYLTEQFNALMTTHNDSIEQANAEIQRLDKARNGLLSQIEELEVVASGDYSDDEAEIQNEISRLEGELEKANAEVAELESYVQDAADRTSYESIDRSQFDAAAASGDVQHGAAVPYTNALVEAVGQEKAVIIVSGDFIQRVNAGLSNLIFRGGVGDITKVDYQNEKVVFYVTNEIESFVLDTVKRSAIRGIQNEISESFIVIDSKGDSFTP